MPPLHGIVGEKHVMGCCRSCAAGWRRRRRAARQLRCTCRCSSWCAGACRRRWPRTRACCAAPSPAACRVLSPYILISNHFVLAAV